MSRNPDDRFASVAEFAEALRRSMSWSDRDAARDFAAQIAQDFSGDMPQALGLEPLAIRDAAWRETQDTSDASRVALKMSPQNPSDAVTKTGPRSKLPKQRPPSHQHCPSPSLALAPGYGWCWAAANHALGDALGRLSQAAE